MVALAPKFNEEGGEDDNNNGDGGCSEDDDDDDDDDGGDDGKGEALTIGTPAAVSVAVAVIEPGESLLSTLVRGCVTARIGGAG